MRSSIGLWVRADWRRRRASLLALTLLAGLSFAVVAVAVAGARRTATSFERLRATTLAYDHGVGDRCARLRTLAMAAATTTPRLRRIEQLPQVAAIGEVVTYVASVARRRLGARAERASRGVRRHTDRTRPDPPRSDAGGAERRRGRGERG